jgi:hypothetical protein
MLGEEDGDILTMAGLDDLQNISQDRLCNLGKVVLHIDHEEDGVLWVYQGFSLPIGL